MGKDRNPVRELEEEEEEEELDEEELDEEELEEELDIDEDERERERRVLEEIRNENKTQHLERKIRINDKNGMVDRLNDIKSKFHEDFHEMMAITADEPIQIVDPDDDLKQEVGFYSQALANVKKARAILDSLNIEHLRPMDFYAEMVKSDHMMARVRQRLLFEKQKMEAFEKRKQQKQYKKVSKQVQAEKIKEKTAKKKKDMKSVDEFRGKKRFRSGGDDEDASAKFSNKKNKRTKPTRSHKGNGDRAIKKRPGKNFRKSQSNNNKKR